MFPWHPARLHPGDILIHRAVRSPHNKLVAVGEVLSMAAPGIADVRATPRGLRVMKALEDDAGRRAVALISATGVDLACGL